MENRSRMNEMQMRRIVSRYELGQLLGRGAYSEVFKARHLDNGGLFAVKVVSNKVLADNQKVKECINNELAIHHVLEPCPHVVRFYQLMQTKNNCYFVYEYCQNGTLHDMLKREGPLQQKRALSILCQLVAGLKVLRRHNIMHRDLKPQNVLINKGIFKLGDFGFCKQLGEAAMTRTMLGSPLYMAPEVLRGEAYTVNADIWSLGVILYEMLEGKCPFESNSIASLISAIDEYPLVFDPNILIAANLKRFILRCLQKDCRARMSWQQLFEQVFHLTDCGPETLSVSLQSFPVIGKSNSRIKEMHSTVTFEEPNPAKRSKYQIFKQNYHKQTESKADQLQIFSTSKQNTRPMCQRSKSSNRPDLSKQKIKQAKIGYGELVAQHQGCLNALKVCMDLLQLRDRKQVVQVGSVLKGIRKVLERIYTRINLQDIEMLPVLSMVKYEMIQVEKMQGEIQKWNGNISEQPDITGLPVALAEPWAVLSSYC